jgi:hypothetical protein
MSEEATDTVIRWALSTPVLALRLREIAREDGEEALIYMTADLMNPHRDDLMTGILHATGTCAAHTEAVWRELGEDRWIHTVSWARIRQALADSVPVE